MCQFPVDGGESYKLVAPNETEITTFPLFLEAIKSANPGKYLAIDVPGRTTDMKNAKYDFAKIVENVSLVNVMAYDMVGANLPLHAV
jgi:chitinase